MSTTLFKAGQILQERYQLQHTLRRSPQSRQTWLAKDLATDSDELVIVKLLVFTEMQWQDLKLFEREAQVLQSLQHPQIPRYRDYFLVDQQMPSFCWWGLVQDYVAGRSLQDLLDQKHQFCEQDVRRIAQDVLQILKYLHALHPPVLHRDIKPSNLILDQHEQIWLVDFGAVQDQATVTGASFTVVGTVGYTPLEQFWGRAIAASDLYALGATLIHLLTGVAPVDLPQRNLRLHWRDRANVSSSFVSWIERLVEPELEKRFNSADRAGKALKSGLYSQITPVSSRVQTLLFHAARNQGKRPAVVGKRPPVVKIATPELLKIKVRKPSYSRLFLLLVYSFWWILTCVVLPLIGGFPALIAGCLFCAFLIAVGVIPLPTADPAPTSIRFCAVDDRFEITTRRYCSTKWEAGAISAIRYLTIAASQTYINQYASFTNWTVIIRADQSYIVDWLLTEEECIWFVNEVQNWLDATKECV